MCGWMRAYTLLSSVCPPIWAMRVTVGLFARYHGWREQSRKEVYRQCEGTQQAEAWTWQGMLQAGRECQRRPGLSSPTRRAIKVALHLAHSISPHLAWHDLPRAVAPPERTFQCTSARCESSPCGPSRTVPQASTAPPVTPVAMNRLVMDRRDWRPLSGSANGNAGNGGCGRERVWLRLSCSSQ